MIDSRSLSTVLAAVFEKKDLPQLTAKEVVNALLDAEKQARKDKPSYQFADLLGSWDLKFVTGIKKIRQQAAPVLGAGRYIPRWAKLKIVYEVDAEMGGGAIANQVDLGVIKLTLRGPCKFLGDRRLLLFDFTRMQLEVAGKTIYRGFIRNGKNKEASFATEPVSKLPFFAFFILEKSVIAARGRSGGLAIWSREVS
jgi:hypothetical protein